MEITSKFNLKDRIFWLEHNKVRSAIVKSIQFPLVQMLKKKETIVGQCMYFVSNRTNSSVINWNGGGLRENQIFKSKKELLKNL